MNVDPYSAQYTALLQAARKQPLHYNDRTGQRIHWLQGGVMITADLSKGVLPIPSNRVYRPYVAAAEAAWILSGERSIEWISKHCSIWNKFASDGTIESAYGYRARQKWGDQLQRAVVSLRKDASTRQCVINLWDGETDGMGLHPAPCPTQIVFNADRQDRKLHCQVFMRSSDLFVGLPYDVMVWSLITDVIASEINYNLGKITFFLAHPHLYAGHADMIAPRFDHKHYFKMPGWPIRYIQAEPDDYVRLAKKRLIREGPVALYDPKPEVYE